MVNNATWATANLILGANLGLNTIGINMARTGTVSLSDIAGPAAGKKRSEKERRMSHTERYKKACHAMQSGVEMMMHYNPMETSSKHLRVSVNSSMVEFGALVRILISKGIITEEEFAKGLADQMEEEAASYSQKLSDLMGVVVKLA